MRLGIDFGTTNSAIALYDGERLITVRTNPGNENPFVLPSLIYIDRQQTRTVGIEAAQAWLENDTGRAVRWRRMVVGSTEIVVAGRGADAIRYQQELAALVDTAARGRLLQSIKTILRNPEYDGTRIFGRFYSVDRLISLLLEQLRACAQTHFGAPCEDIVMGRPVRFAEDAATDARAEEILYKAARGAGFRDIRFASEPLAVTWLYHVKSRALQTSLVFDFGGGTLDLTVARVGGDEPPQILASRGVLVGGDDLDRAIMRWLTKHFGRGVRGGPGMRPVPAEWLGKLDSWQSMPDLSRPQTVAQMREFRASCSDPRALEALETLVTRNLGFRLFREIERCKRHLSEHEEARLDFEHGAIRIHERLGRAHFERLVAPELAAVEAGLRAVVAEAGLKPAEIDVVLRTGGSSTVPAFVELLARLFGAERLRALAPLVSVVGGMAVIAQQGGRPLPPCALRYESDGQRILLAATTCDDSPCERFTLRSGAPAWVDDAFCIDRLPAELGGLPALRMAASKAHRADAWLRLRIAQRARVYVACDSAALELPRWLRGWQRDRHTLEVRDDWRNPRTLRLYSRVFAAGDITLGGARARGFAGELPLNYLVIVKALAPD